MAAPTNLVATAIDDGSVGLTWDAFANASGYDIERDSVVIVTNHPTTSYTNSGLSPGTSYSYRVRAKLDVFGPLYDSALNPILDTNSNPIYVRRE